MPNFGLFDDDPEFQKAIRNYQLQNFYGGLTGAGAGLLSYGLQPGQGTGPIFSGLAGLGRQMDPSELAKAQLQLLQARQLREQGAQQKQLREAYPGLIASAPESLRPTLSALPPAQGAAHLFQYQSEAAKRRSPKENLIEVRGQLYNADDLETARKTGTEPKPLVTVPDRDTAMEARINEMVNTLGVDRGTAAKIATGAVAVVADQNYGGVHIVDKTTGTSRYISGTAPPSSPTPEATAAQPAGAPGRVRPAIDYPEGLGIKGAIGWGANTVSDWFGGKLQAPQAEAAIQGFHNLKLETQTYLQAAIPGRPSVYLMEQLAKISVDPANIFQGRERSYTRLQETRDLIQRELDRMEKDVLAHPGDFPRNVMAETRMNRSQLQTALKRYDVVIDSFERAMKRDEPPKGEWKIRAK